MQPNSRNNFLHILMAVITLACLRPAISHAGSNLLLLYSNDVRSELEACG
ncbi:MAG: hypothetical protein L3J49_13570 [Desulfobulbaceae bacterium]|nr:hypothetical protein [Desulfobulbaceae bacterium]